MIIKIVYIIDHIKKYPVTVKGINIKKTKQVKIIPRTAGW